jgi:hypothetical protein
VSGAARSNIAASGAARRSPRRANRSLYDESSYARHGDGIVYYPELRLGGPAAGFAYCEARTRTRAPRPTRVSLASTARANGDASRVWLVVRDSDVPLHRRERVEHDIARDYTAIKRQTSFRNLTVVLYGRDALRRRA